MQISMQRIRLWRDLALGGPRFIFIQDFIVVCIDSDSAGCKIRSGITVRIRY